MAASSAARVAGLFDARWWPKSPSISETGAQQERRERLARVDVVGRVVALEVVDDRVRVGVVVGLALVGAGDPARHVGVRVAAGGRQVAHRTAGDERLAGRLTGSRRELGG